MELALFTLAALIWATGGMVERSVVLLLSKLAILQCKQQIHRADSRPRGIYCIIRQGARSLALGATLKFSRSLTR